MPSAPLPAPPPYASGTVAGLVSTGTQLLAGSKEFLALILADVGVQSPGVWNTNGSLATDVAVKAGTTLADASVNAGAKLLSVRTGIGGTEVESAFFTKDYFIVGTSSNNYHRAQIYGGAGTAGALSVQAPSGALITGAQDYVGTTLRVQATGRYDMAGTDSSGTPGAATINKPSGRSAIAAGVSSVTITDSLVTAATRVTLTLEGDPSPATVCWVTRAAGSFTLTCNAAVTAATTFNWSLSEML